MFQRGDGTLARWHKGEWTPLETSGERPWRPFAYSRRFTINGKGEVAGSYGSSATLWSGGQRIDLTEAAGGPRLDEAVAISEDGDVLAWGGPMLYLLKRRA